MSEDKTRAEWYNDETPKDGESNCDGNIRPVPPHVPNKPEN